jgi:carbamoyltransferase
MRTEMDYLMLGAFLLDKKEQPYYKKDANWQKSFALD